MMSPEEDIYQLYDIQKEFGEQDQQAPVTEETTGFGQIQVHSSLDHEMTDTSPLEDMSYLQSQMHFDESIEIIAADSDLEDGKIQKKLLTSQLHAKRASGRLDAMVSQEREVKCTNVSPVTGSELLGDRLLCFHQNVMNGETTRGVLRSETPMCRIWVKLYSKAIKITC